MTSCCIYPGSPSSKTHRPPSTHLATLRHHRITTGYLSRKTAIHACNCTLFYAKDTCQIQTFSDLAFLLTLTHVCVSPHKPGPRCPLNIQKLSNNFFFPLILSGCSAEIGHCFGVREHMYSSHTSAVKKAVSLGQSLPLSGLHFLAPSQWCVLSLHSALLSNTTSLERLF